MASALLLKALGRPLSNSYLAGDCGASTVAHPKQERPLSTGQLRLGAILATGSCVSFSAARPDLGVMQSDTPTTTLANVPSGSIAGLSGTVGIFLQPPTRQSDR